MGFSLVYLVSFYLSGKKVTTKNPKYSFSEKMANEGGYIPE